MSRKTSPVNHGQKMECENKVSPFLAGTHYRDFRRNGIGPMLSAWLRECHSHLTGHLEHFRGHFESRVFRRTVRPRPTLVAISNCRGVVIADDHLRPQYWVGR
jgi:hypothetical protein